MIGTRAIWLGVGVLCIAASGLTWWVMKDAEPTFGAEIAQSEMDSAVNTSGASSVSSAVSPSSGFALDTSSLRGTEVDGGVSLDANGNVLLDMRLRRLFDYHLSLIGERDLPQIRQLLGAHLLGRYGAQHADTVLDHFDRYARYLQRLTETRIGDAIDPEERLAKVAALRRQMLGQAMASAFFAEEEALAALTLKRMAIARDATLSADQKSELLSDLDLAENYSARAEADTAGVVTDQDRRFDQSNATAHQRAAEREALWGKEAAGRLAQLDRERAQWDARIEDYLFARSRIDADRTLSPVARAQALAALRAQRFDAAEQRRVASLEAIGQLEPGG